MTTRPVLGDRSSHARSLTPSPSLLASLAKLDAGCPRYLPPTAPQPVCYDRRGDAIDPPPVPKHEQPSVARYPVRHTAVLAPPATTLWRPITALERARLWATAVDMERKTKSRGSRIGCFGGTGLQVLNALLFRFANTATGRCDPSYSALQAVTGLCRQSIADAIDRLTQSGIITVTRRWLRFRNPETGQMTARQITNAYGFAEAAKRLFALPAPLRACRQIPSRSAKDPHGNLARIFKMSLLRRQEPKSPANPVTSFDPKNPSDAGDVSPTSTHSAGG